MKSFGENLKSVRESNKLSQQRLALLMDISQQRVSEWECGKVEPTLRTLLKLIKVLNCSFEELTDGISCD
jgi:transcriptional regulator with XRE-family HTH domain